MPPLTYTIGVEEEYQIIDPTTRDLASSAEYLLPEARKLLGEAVQYELQLSQIEVATPICLTLGEVKEHIARLRRGIITAAKNLDKQIAASGTHPFSRWQNQQITPAERYIALHRNYQQVIREQSIFGCHVHIAIENRHEALQIMNHARGWLALLLALTGNSPFYQSVDTGYASYRTQIWTRWPSSGPPQAFSSLAEYDHVINTFMLLGTIASAREIYWDMRLSSRFKTVEVRIADVCLTVAETVMVAGLVRALIQTCHECVLRGESYLPLRQELVRAAHWQAARYGLDARLVDPRSGQIMPARQLLEQFLQLVQPALQSQGDWEEVSQSVETIVQRGTGAARQREVYSRTGRLQAVVDFVVEETARDV
ncbi:MAG: carboxylate-amine ligase [Ktedonobacteraceae bacterium]|nr:carboxylate-amine ligase [Ktedonobacteraceae bacterium]